MTKKIIVLLLILTLVAACFIGCATTDADKDGAGKAASVTVTDSLGRSITVEKTDKIVCIGAGALRLYSYVGDMSKLCAVEEIEGSRTFGKVSQRAYQIAYENLFTQLINEGKTAGKGGPQAQILNTEVLTALEPDLIFSCLSLSVDELVEAEKAIGCPIITLKYGAQKAFSNEILASLRIIGKVCKKEARAEELVSYMESLKTELASYASEESASVYLACNSNWGVKGFLSSAKNYPLFTISGVTNVLDGDDFIVDKDGFADLEAVVDSGAEKIILDAGGFETFKGEYEDQSSNLPDALEGMEAFKNKEVYLIMPNNAYDANVENYFINAFYVVNVAYGKNIDVEAKANEITKKFLGKDLYNDIIMYGGYQKLNIPDVWPEK
ncbi:MAG: ABC transporter substrate-binding protein [Clostridia bacterium]|nr:ABC transporter substrate-binding protein [Clostridia bacterium]